jgi:hypothetical protein
MVLHEEAQEWYRSSLSSKCHRCQQARRSKSHPQGLERISIRPRVMTGKRALQSMETNLFRPSQVLQEDEMSVGSQQTSDAGPSGVVARGDDRLGGPVVCGHWTVKPLLLYMAVNSAII